MAVIRTTDTKSKGAKNLADLVKHAESLGFRLQPNPPWLANPDGETRQVIANRLREAAVIIDKYFNLDMLDTHRDFVTQMGAYLLAYAEQVETTEDEIADGNAAEVGDVGEDAKAADTRDGRDDVDASASPDTGNGQDRGIGRSGDDDTGGNGELHT